MIIVVDFCSSKLIIFALKSTLGCSKFGGRDPPLGQPKLIKIFAFARAFFPGVFENAVLWVCYSKSCYEFVIEKDNSQARRRRKIFEDLGTWNVKFPLQKCVLGSQILQNFRLRRAHGSSSLIFQGSLKIEKNNYFSLGNTPKVPKKFACGRLQQICPDLWK